MGIIVKVLAFMLSLTVCYGAHHRRDLIAPAPASSGGGIPTANLVVWIDATNVMKGTNSVGTTPPSNGDTLSGWDSSINTGISVVGDEIWNSTGGTSNRARIFNNTGASQLSCSPNDTQLFIQPVTVFMVVRLESSTGAWLGNSGADGCKGEYYTPSTLAVYSYGGGSTSLIGDATGLLNQWFLLTAKYNGTNSFLRTNGVDYVSGDVGTNNFKGFKIGNQLGLGKPLNGSFMDFILYTGAVNHVTVENYLKQKHGL